MCTDLHGAPAGVGSIGRAEHRPRPTDRRLRAKSHPGRALHLVDIENLTRGWHARRDGLAVLDAYLRRARWSAGDHLVLAGRPAVTRALMWDFIVPSRWVCDDDPIAGLLSQAVDRAQVERSYERVVLGSGNGRLSGLAADVAWRGLTVEVVTLWDQLASTLGRVAHRCVYFVPPATPSTRLEAGPGSAPTTTSHGPDGALSGSSRRVSHRWDRTRGHGSRRIAPGAASRTAAERPSGCVSVSSPTS